jgi:hypothetical protein
MSEIGMPAMGPRVGPIQRIAAFAIKSSLSTQMLSKSPFSYSFDPSNVTTQPTVEEARKSSARILATLHERQSALRSLFPEQQAERPGSLSLQAVHKHLIEIARAAAELLELATRADELSGVAGTRNGRGMSALADTSFDVIMRIDLLRHELEDAALSDPAQASRLAGEGLRAMRKALAQLQRQLSRALAN